MTNNTRASSGNGHYDQQNWDKIAGIAACLNAPLLRLMWRWPVCEMCCYLFFTLRKRSALLITSCSPLLYSTQ